MDFIVDLRLFDGEGAGDSGLAAGGEIGTQNGGTIVDTPDRQAEFDKFIELNKDLYDKRVSKQIQDRHKDYQAMKQRADSLNPVLDMLAQKYGVDSSNLDELTKAIQDDDSYYEEEALQKGLTVEQLKYIKKMERENAEFKRIADEQERRINADRIYGQWMQQSENLRQIIPNFDLQSECSAPETGERFMSLLKSGVDVKTAYQVIHMDEMIGGSMQYAAQQVRQKTINDIRTRGIRPTENGGNNAVTTQKSDPGTWTRQKREEIARRVMRGERIEL